MFFALLALLGCDPGPTQGSADDADGSGCAHGSALQVDGHCHPVREPSLDDALRALGPCVPAGGEGGVDVLAGCAGGACVGQTVLEMMDALGTSVACANTATDPTAVVCGWPALGIDGLFRDANLDGVVDASSGNERVHLYGPHQGASPEGMGIGASVACFVDALGPPDRLYAMQVGGELTVRDLYYDALGVYAYDLGDDDGSGRPNGFIDRLYLYGP